MDLLSSHYGTNVITNTRAANGIVAVSANNNFSTVDAAYKNFATLISTPTVSNLTAISTITTTANDESFTVNNNSNNIYSNTFNNSATVFSDFGFTSNFPSLQSYPQFPCGNTTSTTMFDNSGSFASSYCNLAPFGYTQYPSMGNSFNDTSAYPSSLAAMSSLTSSTLTSNLVPTTNSLFMTTPCSQQNSFLSPLEYLNGTSASCWSSFATNSPLTSNTTQNSIVFDSTLKTIKTEKNKKNESDDKNNIETSKRKHKSVLNLNEKLKEDKSLGSKYRKI